ncbi:hypothetical protein BC830DRAFT_320910 [Chytriomyces sp. MP71]|nr:hypothetical protein BC830DRAFT_320910 [Chytriomyces sp. MP71]
MVPTEPSFESLFEVAHDELQVVDALKNLRSEIFLSVSSKSPIEYLSDLTAILETSRIVREGRLLNPQAIRLMDLIQSKCLIDMECNDKMDYIVNTFVAEGVAPGKVFSDGANVANRIPLYKWIIKNQKHPFPTEEEKEELARQTGLTVASVNHWFVNSRRRKVVERDDLNMLYADGPLLL